MNQRAKSEEIKISIFQRHSGYWQIVNFKMTKNITFGKNCSPLIRW